jgi:maltose O-acetyltransferase
MKDEAGVSMIKNKLKSKLLGWYEAFHIILRDCIVNGLAGACICPRSLRVMIYRLWGMKISTKAICSKCFFGGNKLSINEGSFITYKCFFDMIAPISIGRNVLIGMGYSLITGTHEIGSENRRGGYTPQTL